MNATIRPVKVLSPMVRLGPAPKVKGEGVEVQPGTIRVFAKNNVLGLRANHWGDVATDRRGLEECIRRGFVLVEGPDGEPAPLRLPPRSCAGCGGSGQH